jgi:hypothetical protein
MNTDSDEEPGLGPGTVDVSEAVQFAESFPATDAAGKFVARKNMLLS